MAAVTKQTQQKHRERIEEAFKKCEGKQDNVEDIKNDDKEHETSASLDLTVKKENNHIQAQVCILLYYSAPLFVVN